MTEETNSVIQTTDLVKDRHSQFLRKTVRAVDGLNLSVRKGETFGLLGANGAGKSTVVKLLLGLMRPTSGSCSVRGRQPGDPEALVKIGYLPENPNFYRHLSASEVLDFYGRLLGMPKAARRERVPELLALVSLTSAASMPVSAMSKGMIQRLALAQCLINEPELVILDEPESGLDPIGRRDLRSILLALKKKGTTILLNSHSLPDVSEVCDRVAVLHRGKIIGEGATRTICSSGNYLDLEQYFMDRISDAELTSHSH